MMMRSAKSCGDITILYPPGITRAYEVPVDLTNAISHAQMVLSWYENRPSQEIPPEWMWPFDSLLEGWFEKVDEKRKDSTSSAGDTAVPMMRNELVRGNQRG